jgi:signal transduction histidine kinase/CheY-like chemotaxis protein
MKTRAPLFRKYVRTLIVCMGGLTCAVGLIHLVVVARAQMTGVASLLNAQAETAGGQIRSFMDSTVASLRWIDDIDEPGAPAEYDAIRDGGYRLLRRVPSVIAITFFDGQGCGRVFISRLQPDISTGCSSAQASNAMFTQARAKGTAYSDVFSPDGSEPHLYVGIASRGRNTGALVAEINLKVIHDTVAAIRVGTSGIGFVVDSNRRLIAHPDETLVLRQSQLPESFSTPKRIGELTFATDFAGQRIVTTSRIIDGPGWRVIAVQPVNEALLPVYTALLTTGALVIAAILGSLVAGYIVAARLARPLSILRDGAARIGQGDLSTQLVIDTGDEIEQVADEFNRMARALADSHAHLETKVFDRTAALQATTKKVQQQASELSGLNQTLTQSLDEAQRRKEDAERANAAKSRFLAVASHDLRQPMHAISLLVGLLSQKVHGPDLIGILSKLQGSVDAMEDLFNSLLDISKLDAGAVHPHIEEFPIEELLERVRSSFAAVADQKGIELQVVSSSAIVRSDAALLERIIFNLVSNGIRYTIKGHVSLGVIRDGDLLQVAVQDTGVGIAAEYHQRIYDEFFQIATPARNRSGGLGLGLSIVKQCADLLGHTVSMQSSASGSRFQVDVPFVGVLEAVKIFGWNACKVSETLSRAFVIIIDDNADSRFATAETYRQWGCAVLAAESLPEALEALREHLRSPDLIVSDFNLGEQASGLAAVEALRARVESLVPAIVVTGAPGLVQLNAVDDSIVVLQKPVGAERLREVSERLLQRAQDDAIRT